MSVNFSDSITITRTAKGSYISGEYTAGAQTTVTVNGNIQSESVSTGADLDLIARSNGRYTDGTICIRCNEQLYTDDSDGAYDADRLDWQGKAYEVIKASYRGTIAELAHWKCFAQAIDPNADGSAML